MFYLHQLRLLGCCGGVREHPLQCPRKIGERRRHLAQDKTRDHSSTRDFRHLQTSSDTPWKLLRRLWHGDSKILKTNATKHCECEQKTEKHQKSIRKASEKHQKSIRKASEKHQSWADLFFSKLVQLRCQGGLGFGPTRHTGVSDLRQVVFVLYSESVCPRSVHGFHGCRTWCPEDVQIALGFRSFSSVFLCLPLFSCPEIQVCFASKYVGTSKQTMTHDKISHPRAVGEKRAVGMAWKEVVPCFRRGQDQAWFMSFHQQMVADHKMFDSWGSSSWNF